MQDEKMTIGQTASQLQVTNATIRNWVNIYGPSHLSADAQRKTGKRFTPEDVSVLRKVQQLLAGGLTYDQVLENMPKTPEVLPERPETGEKQPPEDEIPATGQLQTIDLMERVYSMLEQQQQQFQVTLDAKDELISELKQDKQRLQDEITQLKKPWYRRIFEK